MASPANKKRANDGGSGDGGEPPAKRFKPSYSDTITVLVGSFPQKFSVHKDAVCAKSPFFEAACKESWSEGQEGIVKLPDYAISEFKLFAHWVYTDKFDLDILKNRVPNAEISYFVDAWRLGDFLGCIELCNKIIDEFIAFLGSHPNARFPHEISMRKAPEGSTLRRVLVDMTAWRTTYQGFELHGQNWPADYLRDVTGTLFNRFARPNFNPINQAKCYYHTHPEGTPKCT